jgi:ABC-type multidrug transport system ATPase subunit
MNEDRRTVVELLDIRFRYHPRSRWWRRPASDPPELECESLRLQAGLTLLLGPNGSGKSTLLKLLAGVESPETGSIKIDGRDLWKEERDARLGLAYVPEQPDLTPYAAVNEVIRLVCSLRSAPPTAGHRALAMVGMEDLGHRSVRELSLGQRRRVLFAAAFVGEPNVVLLDEPLVALDLGTRAVVLEWLEQRVRAGAAAIVSTHEIDPFVSSVEHAVVMKRGRPAQFRVPTAGSERLAQLSEWARGQP